jgi:hypothetical protein
MGDGQGIAARLDGLVQIALDNADKAENERVEAIKQALPSEGLDELAEAAKARFDAIAATGQKTPELEAALSQLADVYTALIPQAPDTAEAVESEAPAPAAEDAAPAPQVQDEPAAGSDLVPAHEVAPGAGLDVVNDTQREPVMAGTPDIMSHKQLRSVPLANFPTDEVGKPVRGRFRAQAAGDTHDITAGSQFSSLGQIAEVTFDKLRGLADGGGGYTRTGIATWQEEGQADLYTGMSAIEAGQVLDGICNPSKLAFDASTMTFGQGWCRPSDLLLDLCPPAATDGMWDAPSITISGGGVRYPVDVGFADVYSNTGFCFTEAEEIARTEDKPCYMVPCPEFEEVRLDFCGLCIEAGTLVDLAYPQLISGFLAKALAAFEHKLNARALQAAWDKATPVDMTTGTGALTRRGLPGLIGTVLNTIAMQASWLRYRHRLPINSILEVVAPAFLRDMLQADATLRGAVETFLGITSGTIDSWFAARRLRVQWVYDFDDAYSEEDDTLWGGATPPRDWPESVKILIYPAGTFALAQRPMVRVSGVRNDPQLLRQNVFLALFLETAYAVISRCPEAIALTIPTCVSGEAVLTSVPMDPRCAPVTP